MNSAQRRKHMTAKHYRMPLGSDVIVDRGGHYLRAKIFKHDSDSPHKCLVRFPNECVEWVTLHSVKPVKRLRAKPWYQGL